MPERIDARAVHPLKKDGKRHETFAPASHVSACAGTPAPTPGGQSRSETRSRTIVPDYFHVQDGASTAALRLHRAQ